MLISDDYRKLNAELHAKSGVWGLTPLEDLHLIEHLLQKNKIESILDYGCGKGRLGKVMQGGIPVQSYDPAVPEFAAEPKPADMVVCTSVLEHIEPESLDAVLDELKFLTWKLIMIKVACYPSRHFLSDGRNAHLIIQPFEWWLPKLMERWKVKALETTHNAFTFVGKT